MTPDTVAALDLLAWAAGTGSAPAAVRASVEDALAGVELDDRPAIQVAYVVLGHVRTRVQQEIPQVAAPAFRAALTGPQWSTVADPHPGLAERIEQIIRRAVADLLPVKAAEILAEHDREVQAHQQKMADLAAAEQRRDAIVAGADEVRRRRDRTAGYERGTRMAAGALAAVVKADIAAGQATIDLTGLAELMGLSRPSVYKYADEATQAAGYDVTGVNNARLAEMHLGYGPGLHEVVDREFWQRFPHLEGWYRAASWLDQQHRDAWHDEQGGFDPFTSQTPPPLPAYEQLMDQYRTVVQGIADEPTIPTPSGSKTHGNAGVDPPTAPA